VNDIVDRLRVRWEAMGDMANDEREEAANAIYNLRAELQNAYDRIKTLTDERDEARRDVCWSHPDSQVGPEQAFETEAERGWDCFTDRNAIRKDWGIPPKEDGK